MGVAHGACTQRSPPFSSSPLEPSPDDSHSALPTADEGEMARSGNRKIWDPFTRGTIRGQVVRVVRAARIPHYEREDLEQDLTLHLLRRERSYDPTRGSWSTFARCVIERKASSLLASARTARRGRSDELVDQDLYLWATRHAAPSLENLTSLRVDVRRAVEALDPQDRELARSLMDERVIEVSRRTGIPRSTLYGRIARIRKAFAEQRLDSHLNNASTF